MTFVAARSVVSRRPTVVAASPALLEWQLMSVPEHERTVPVFGSPAATDSGSPVSGTRIPYRTWSSPLLDASTGDVYLFGSMHGDYVGNDVDVIRLADSLTGTALMHEPPPDRVRVPNEGDPSYGAGGPSDYVWYEGKGYAEHPAQGEPTSHWWQSYSMHGWERTQFSPHFGMLAMGSGVSGWNDPDPPTTSSCLLGWTRTGTEVGGGVQRWHVVATLPPLEGAHGGGLSDFAPDIGDGVTLQFAAPSSADRTRVVVLDETGDWTLRYDEATAFPYASPPGKGGSAHVYLGGGLFLNLVSGATGSGEAISTSVYDYAGNAFSEDRRQSGGTALPEEFGAGFALDSTNLYACCDRAASRIYWAQVIDDSGTYRLAVWHAPVASPYALTALEPAEQITLSNGNNKNSTAFGRRALHYYGGRLWFFSHNGTNAPSNRPVGSYDVWRIRVG